MAIDDTAAAAPNGAARTLRRDAQRNREGLLAAARECFAAHGLDAPLEQVAKRAGVAIGTLYRHFPTRTDLIQAIFVEKMQTLLDAAEHAVTMDDTWQAFCFFLETRCELQAGDRGFNDLSSMRLPGLAGIDCAQARVLQLAVEILRRAQQQGTVRPDVTAEDVVFVIWSHGGVVEATQGIAPDAWRRYLHLILDAFRANRAHPLPGPPLSPEQVDQAMIRLGGSGGCPT